MGRLEPGNASPGNIRSFHGNRPETADRSQLVEPRIGDTRFETHHCQTRTARKLRQRVIGDQAVVEVETFKVWLGLEVHETGPDDIGAAEIEFGQLLHRPEMHEPGVRHLRAAQIQRLERRKIGQELRP